MCFYSKHSDIQCVLFLKLIRYDPKFDKVVYIMKNKLALILGGLMVSSVAYAGCPMMTEGGVGVGGMVGCKAGPVDYVYHGPNFSGYYNYAVGAPFDYSGPNFRGYYNYPVAGPYPYTGPNYRGYYNYGTPGPCQGEVVGEVVIVK